MNDTREIIILAAPPYLTVQDLGRPGYRAQGVPASGAMDPLALSMANVLVGNPPGAAALEWALAGGTIEWRRPGWCALAGARVDALLDGAPVGAHRTYRVQAGSRLAIQRFLEGRFVYVATDGGIDVPLVLGSRATYLPGRFGGLDGRLLRAEDRLPLGAPTGLRPRDGFAIPPALEPRSDQIACRVIPGPHAPLFGPSAWEELTSATFRIDRGSDRMGYRLAAGTVRHSVDTTLPSAPVCAGAVQVPSGGLPIVLMADAPTVGGYPVLAVVGSADLPLLAQRQPGEEIRFRPSTVTELQRVLRARAVAVHTVVHLVRGG